VSVSVRVGVRWQSYSDPNLTDSLGNQLESIVGYQWKEADVGPILALSSHDLAASELPGESLVASLPGGPYIER
jgi:hypothetical protein